MQQPDACSEWENENRNHAFAAFYDQHREGILRFFVKKTGRREDSEDLTQTVFARALEAWERFRFPVHRPAWLQRIAGNLLIDYYRAAEVRSRFAAESAGWDVAFEDDAFDRVEWRAFKDTYSQALSRLTERQRLVAKLFFAGIPQQVVARELGLERSSVRALVFRARRTLRADGQLLEWAVPTMKPIVATKPPEQRPAQ